jgi:hypothetical protein
VIPEENVGDGPEVGAVEEGVTDEEVHGVLAATALEGTAGLAQVLGS